MKGYYDSGLILKLYTEEPESIVVREFVVNRGVAIGFNELHLAECTSALRLKQFRSECSPEQVEMALGWVQNDLEAGVLRAEPLEWGVVWRRCREISDRFAGTTGCRTLDALHVASAVVNDAREFVSSDERQLALAKVVGLRALNPVG